MMCLPTNIIGKMFNLDFKNGIGCQDLKKIDEMNLLTTMRVCQRRSFIYEKAIGI